MVDISEKRLVEDYIVERLIKFKKWRFVDARNLKREDLREPLLIPDLINAIKRLNKDVELTNESLAF